MKYNTFLKNISYLKNVLHLCNLGDLIAAPFFVLLII
jgi:hypothetical protein